MYLEHLLLYAAIFGTFTSTIFFAMVLVAACRYVLQARKRRLQAKSFPERKFPAVTILKPVHGAEPRLEETLESFFRQDYPDFEIIFGARSRDNAAVAVVERLRAKYPHVPSKMIFSGEPSWPNAKVFSLAKMMAESENAFFAISDSDILVRPDFLRNVMPPLDDPRVGLVTCLYQGIPAPDFWSHLEALGMSVELPSGVMVADLVEGMKFALGASMVVRREAVAAIGGMREAADFYSDDFVLGNRVAEAGYEVVLSHYKVGHVLTAQTLRQTLRRSAALDEEHPLLATLGTRRIRTHLCRTLWRAGTAGGTGSSRVADTGPWSAGYRLAEPHDPGAAGWLGHHS